MTSLKAILEEKVEMVEFKGKLPEGEMAVKMTMKMTLKW
jgi:hypothetical protein